MNPSDETPSVSLPASLRSLVESGKVNVENTDDTVSISAPMAIGLNDTYRRMIDTAQHRLESKGYSVNITYTDE